ncbi:hypothetical protein ACHAPT_013511 [Fusarium lateritium]
MAVYVKWRIIRSVPLVEFGTHLDQYLHHGLVSTNCGIEERGLAANALGFDVCTHFNEKPHRGLIPTDRGGQEWGIASAVRGVDVGPSLD